MENQEQIKKMVREKYSEIVQGKASCCGSKNDLVQIDYTIFSEDYSQLKGYNPDADLGLGCGVPTEYARIKEGDTVVDLGSGAGNDCFVVRAVIGEKGKVIGIDMTETMIAKARANAEKLGLNNVEFRFGEIENMPINDNVADVVISNCVLNLVPDKRKAFSETYRVLKPSGHFSISDMVTNVTLPEGLRNVAAMYAGCVAGALQKDEYLSIIREAGFQNVTVQKERKIELPDELLHKYLTEEDIRNLKESNVGVFSISVYAEKPE